MRQVTSVLIAVALSGLAAPPLVKAQEGARAENRGTEKTDEETASSEGPASSEDETVNAAEQAKAEFAAGNSAYEARRYAEAAQAFEKAHALAPHSAVLFNAAKAWWKVGELERAADDYAEAVQRGELTSEQTLRARASLARLRKKLGWITIRGSSDAQVTVGYHAGAALPLTTHLAPGEHMLEVTDGEESWNQIVSVQADAPLSVVAKPTKETASDAAPASSTAPVSGGRGQRNAGIATLAAGAALGIGAGITGALTLTANSDFKNLNTGDDPAAAQDARDKASTLKTVTNVLAFTGAAAGIVGVTLLLTLPNANVTADSAKAPFVHQAALNFGPGRVTLIGHF